MADATDSKSVGSDTVWVQVPPSAPKWVKSSGFTYFFVIFYHFWKVKLIFLAVFKAKQSIFANFYADCEVKFYTI